MKIQLLGHDVTEKYSSTPTNFTTTGNRALETQPDPFVVDAQMLFTPWF